jgi:prepilin-type N-terminal cleavage/methylation domain-containing protein
MQQASSNCGFPIADCGLPSAVGESAIGNSQSGIHRRSAPGISSGFTLVELLVVIAIIGVLVALLLPAIQSSREASRRATCLDNMKQIAFAVLNYEAHLGSLPLAYSPNDTSDQLYGSCTSSGKIPNTKKKGGKLGKLQTRHSLFTFILPYLERQQVYDAIDFKLDWGQPGYDPKKNETQPATHVDIKEYLCPSADSRRGAYTTDYATFVNIEPRNYCRLEGPVSQVSKKRPVEKLAGMLSDIPLRVTSPADVPSASPSTESAVKSASIKDGLSKTFMLFESAGKPNHYLRGVFDFDNPVPRGKYEWASQKANYSDIVNNPVFYGNGDQTVCALSTIMNCNNDHQIYSFHPSGAIFAFGDGRADLILDSIDLDIFISFFTRAAGDLVGVR